jgi:hypothetical protein
MSTLERKISESFAAVEDTGLEVPAVHQVACSFGQVLAIADARVAVPGSAR